MEPTNPRRRSCGLRGTASTVRYWMRTLIAIRARVGTRPDEVKYEDIFLPAGYTHPQTETGRGRYFFLPRVTCRVPEFGPHKISDQYTL
jgi:hypothetical protein